MPSTNSIDQIEKPALVASDISLDTHQTKLENPTIPHTPTGFFITQQEISQLSGVSDLAFRTYMRLRQRMDMASKISGRVVRHSLDALAEFAETHIPRGRGWEIKRPSRKQILTALARLTQIGLIQPLGQLVFLLPLAYCKPKTPPKTAPNRPHKQGTVVAEKTPVETRRKLYSPHKPGTHQAVSFIKAKHGTTSDHTCSVGQTEPQQAHENAAAVSWFKEFTANTGRKVAYRADSPLLANISQVGKARVLSALYAAHAARQRDNSPAPLNLPFVSRFITHPTNHTHTQASTKPPVHLHIPLPLPDPQAEAKGRALLARIKQSRELRQHLPSTQPQ